MEPMSDEELKRMIAAKASGERLPSCDVDALLAEVVRLREIVAKLPKTADGVEIVPGMKLYGVYGRNVYDDLGPVRNVPMPTVTEFGHPMIPLGHQQTMRSNQLFSTRSAAEAARGKE